MTRDADAHRPAAHGPVFWAGVVVGWTVMGVAIAGIVDQATRTKPAPLARVLVGLAVAHDLVLAPLVFAVGAVVRRVVPTAVKPFVTAGLVASGVVTLYAVPMVLGRGRRADDPSTLPLNYAHGLLQVLAVIWLSMVGAATVAVLGHRWRSSRGSPVRR